MIELEPIKRRLAAIANDLPWNTCEPVGYYPPGRSWTAEQMEYMWWVGKRPGVAVALVDGTKERPGETRAQFIAQAPTDIAALLSEVERLRANVMQHAEEAHVYFSALLDLAEGAEQQSQSHADILARIQQARKLAQDRVEQVQLTAVETLMNCQDVQEMIDVQPQN